MAERKKVATRKSGAAVKKKTVRKKSNKHKTPKRSVLKEGSRTEAQKTKLAGSGDLGEIKGETKIKRSKEKKKKTIRKDGKAKTRTKDKNGKKVGTGRQSKTDPKEVTYAVQQARKDGPEGEDLQQTAPKRKARRLPSLSRMERDVRFVLMDLMATSDSDSVRVAAAKALMDKVNKEQGEVTDEQERRTKERDDAIAEAGRLLAELAALKSYGARHKAKVA